MPSLADGPYDGLVTDVIVEVVTLLRDAKGTLGDGVKAKLVEAAPSGEARDESPLEDGISEVIHGEVQENWRNPALLVLGGPRGSPLTNSSDRRGTDQHDVDLLILCLSRKTWGSDDLAVGVCLENVANELHAAGSVAGAPQAEFPNPISINRKPQEGNAYTTVGQLEVQFPKTVERR